MNKYNLLKCPKIKTKYKLHRLTNLCPLLQLLNYLKSNNHQTLFRLTVEVETFLINQLLHKCSMDLIKAWVRTKKLINSCLQASRF